MLIGENLVLYATCKAGHPLSFETIIVNRDFNTLKRNAFKNRYGMTKLKWLTEILLNGDPCKANHRIHESVLKTLYFTPMES